MTVPEPASLDLLDTDVHTSLRETLHGLLAARCDPETLIAMYDGDRSPVATLWHALAGDLGLAGLLVPEEYGGAGATAREAGVVLTELGSSVAPVPFLTSAVVATVAAVAAGDAELLGGLADGSRTAALVVPLTSTPFGTLPALPGLTGSIPAVAGVLDADVLLVPVRAGSGVELHRVEVSDPGVTFAPAVSLDMTRQVADVRLDGPSSTVLLAGDAGEQAVRDALLAGAALLASEQAGLAARCLSDTVAYLQQRYQFGRPLAGYQALKHRLADLYVEAESARAAATYAAAAVAAGEDVEVATCVAQAYCSDAAVHAAEERVQLHGGIGMTWEHPSHLYLKRAKADQLAFGSPGRHLDRLATLVDLPA